MNNTFSFKPLLLALLFSTLGAQASLFDYYGIPNAKDMPRDIEQVIIKKILLQHPFPFTPKQQFSLKEPTASIRTHYSSISGVKFDNNVTLVLQNIDALTTAPCQIWKKEGNSWTLSDQTDFRGPLTTIAIEPAQTFYTKPKHTTIHLTNYGKSSVYETINNKNKIVFFHLQKLYLNSINSTWQLYYGQTIDTMMVADTDITMPFIAVINVSNPKNLEIWKRIGGNRWKLVALVDHDQDVYSASFDSEYKQLATTSQDNQVRIWNIDCLHTTITDYVENKTITLEQLLFLKFLNDVSIAKPKLCRGISNQIPADNLDFAAQLLGGNSLASNKEYLNNILDSFGNEVKQELIKRYNVTNFTVGMSSCSIQ
ncbi:hypothetical protein H0X48_04680 [Candidatus Dependentiae bacterium]|nr:hypothetical protein [Candidatus Dependentiae bacterium]